MTKNSLTYRDSGVDYGALDLYKRTAAGRAATTDSFLARFGGYVRALPQSRGESGFVLEFPDHYIAHVEEGLGTKILVADEVFHTMGDSSVYFGIGQDTVAMIVNDLATVGAIPISVAMHVACGDSNWFSLGDRGSHLIEGWEHACMLAGSAWGPGETPALKGVVEPKTLLLSGSAVGMVHPKNRLIMPKVEAGDAIVILGSSGVHANGLTLVRKIVESLPRRYFTELPGGGTFGGALLRPTHIYVRVIEACLKRGIPIHYAVNITGHGWRKLMRAKESFAYVMDYLFPEDPLFAFIRESGPVDLREMYGTFNMGAGFALIVPADQTGAVLEVVGKEQAENSKDRFRAYVMGHVETSETRRVVLPNGIEFKGEELDIR